MRLAAFPIRLLESRQVLCAAGQAAIGRIGSFLDCTKGHFTRSAAVEVAIVAKAPSVKRKSSHSGIAIADVLAVAMPICSPSAARGTTRPAMSWA